MLSIPLRISNRESWWPTCLPHFFWGGKHEKPWKNHETSRSSYAAQGHLPPISGGRRPATGAGGAAALRRDFGDLAARGTAAGGDLWTSAVEGGLGGRHEDVDWLVVWKIFIHFLFFHILGIIMNNHLNWLIFFRRGRSTTNQLIFMAVLMDNDMYNSIIKLKTKWTCGAKWRTSAAIGSQTWLAGKSPN